MYKIIEPHAHELHSERINSLLGLLKIYQNFYLDPEAQDRATFVIAEDDKRGVYGGTVLYPRSPYEVPSFLELLPEDMDNELLDQLALRVQPNVKEYWTARICLCLGHDRTTPLRETVKLYRSFYHNLYKAFCYFGEKENIHYLPFTLRATDTHVDNNLHILTYQTWPSLLGVKHSNNGFHSYFHGILSLKDALKKSTLKANPFKGSPRKGTPLQANPSKKQRYSQRINAYPAFQIHTGFNFSSPEWRA